MTVPQMRAQVKKTKHLGVLSGCTASDAPMLSVADRHLGTFPSVFLSCFCQKRYRTWTYTGTYTFPTGTVFMLIFSFLKQIRRYLLVLSLHLVFIPFLDEWVAWVRLSYLFAELDFVLKKINWRGNFQWTKQLLQTSRKWPWLDLEGMPL